MELDLQVGQELPQRTRHVSQELMLRYTHTLGAGNPIHFDASYAAQTHFGGPIASGPIALGLLDDAMAAAFPREWLTAGTLAVAFVKPVRPGDTISTSIRLRDIAHQGGAVRLVFEAECLNQRRETVLAGTASVRRGGRR
jgi:acyl dehydratase